MAGTRHRLDEAGVWGGRGVPAALDEPSWVTEVLLGHWKSVRRDWLDLMTLEVFSNLNDSVVLYQQPSRSASSRASAALAREEVSDDSLMFCEAF